jgi:hypothetical protein
VKVFPSRQVDLLYGHVAVREIPGETQEISLENFDTSPRKYR